MLLMNAWSAGLMGGWLALDWGLAAALPGWWRESELQAAAAFVARFPEVQPRGWG